MDHYITVTIFNLDHFTGCTYYKEKRFKIRLFAYIYCAFNRNAYICEGQVMDNGLCNYNKWRKTIH